MALSLKGPVSVSSVLLFLLCSPLHLSAVSPPPPPSFLSWLTAAAVLSCQLRLCGCSRDLPAGHSGYLISFFFFSSWNKIFISIFGRESSGYVMTWKRPARRRANGSMEEKVSVQHKRGEDVTQRAALAAAARSGGSSKVSPQELNPQTRLCTLKKKKTPAGPETTADKVS